jgi:predicted acetyltransferase
MIADHFERSLARGEAVSTLYAAETEIYQRFGYGHAAPSLGMELSRGVKLREVEAANDLTVVIDSAHRDKHGPVIRSIQARMTRPGTVTEYTDDYEADLFMDLESDLSSQGEELRVVIIKDGDDPVAFSLLTRKGDWTPHGPDGKVSVRCWAALTTPAEHRLFSVLADFDLMSSTRINKIAHDAPIVHLLADMRGAKMTVNDNLWLRVLNVPAALDARGYAADCDVRIGLEDAQIPDNTGTWRLHVTDGAASIVRTDEQPEVSMNIQELGTVYLGGPTVIELCRAGIVTEHRDGAALELSRAMESDLKPVANLNF